MKITKIGSQVEQNPLRVCYYVRTKVMVLVVDFKAVGAELNLCKFKHVGAYRVSGRSQTYNDWYWM